MNKLAAALAWASRGFRIFPILPNSKKPAWEGWTEFATTDPERIRAWWDGVDFNIGVETTGLLVLDIDTKEGRRGMATFMDIHGAFDTLTIRTPSGGYHCYYAGADVANSQGEQGGLGPGLDVRSHHGFVLAPGSTIDGMPYAVEFDEPVQPAPQHLVARCKAPRERMENATVAVVDLDSPSAVAAAQQRIAQTEGAIRGDQSIAAYRVACMVRDLGISEIMAGTLLDEWAARCEPPIDAEDLRGRVANAYAYAQNPAGAKAAEHVFAGVTIEPLPPEALAPERTGNRFRKWGNAGGPNDVCARRHVFRNFSQAGEVTAIIGEGGAGKSALNIAAAVLGSVGKDLYGFKNMVGPFRSIIYDAEDSFEEMQRRFHAACFHFGVPYQDAAPMISLVSGREERFRLVNGTAQTLEVNKEVVDDLIEIARAEGVGMIAINPLNKMHSASGIDNSQMTFVMDVIELVAQHTGAFVLLSHHTSKQSFASSKGYAGNADASQGASAVKDNIRAVFTMMTASDEDCSRYGILETERKQFTRLDSAKVNHARASGEATWLERTGVKLVNGEDAVVLAAADMDSRIARTNKRMADTLAAVMVEKGGGGLSMEEAAKGLKAADPIYGPMQTATVRTRIQAALYGGVATESGALMVIHESGGKQTIGYRE